MATPSYILKRNRAYAELEALREEIERWKDADSYRVSHEHDSQSAETIVEATLNEPIPESWAVSLGTFLFLMRSALDHVAYALLVKTGNATQAQLERIQFPIFKDPADFLAATTSSKNGKVPPLQLLPDPVKAILDGVQPYHGKDDLGGTTPFERTTLGLLHLLNNVDKHRTLVIVGARVDVAAASHDGFAFVQVNDGGQVSSDDGTELARFVHRPFEAGAKTEFDATLAFDVVLAEPGLPSGYLVEQVVISIFKIVNGILSALEPFL